MNEWKEYKLKDVANVKYGKAHQSLSDGYIPAYGSGGLIRYVEKALYNEESILIPRKGTLNNIIYKDEPFWTVDTMFWTELNKKIIVPKYLFYQLSLIDFSNMNVGSAVPSMTIPILNDIDIYVPSIPAQTAISSILSSLDDKIDLLHRQNATLEKLAETLFRQWFVEEAKEEWESKQLKEVTDIAIGRTPPRKESKWFTTNPLDIKWISIKDLGDDGMFISNTTEYLTKEAVDTFNIPVIPKDTIVLSFKMTVGRVAITSEEMLSNEAIAHFKFNNNTPFCKEYLYLFLKTYKYETLGSTSSIVTAINSAMIKEMGIVIPNECTMMAFKEESEPLFNKIKSNQTQIRTITALRDTLLPKLMSGEVRVEPD